MAPIRYSLHYEDYSEHLMSRFGKLLQMQSLVDMTLMCSSHTLRVHKAVLAASSVYFQEVLQKQPGEPLIILKMRFSVLKCLVEFMYCGKTQCLEENLDELVSAAQFLKIKGLSKVTKEGLGIVNSSELPVFTPPVVINRPPQSLIDLHSQAMSEVKPPPQHTSTTSSSQPGDNLGRSKRPAGSWDSSGALGRAAERALLRREQDSRKAIHQLKHLQSRHMQDYMERVTLSQAVNSICGPETSSSHNYMNIDNDLIYMDPNVSANVLDPAVSYSKENTLGNETITSSYSTTATSSASDANSGGISTAMSQYVNALKSAGLPTDLPILFESGDGSYINVNEQVLLDMVQSSEIQYEVIEQPNIIEKVADPSEIKSIDDLSKSIERGEILMGNKSYDSNSYNKDSTQFSRHDDAINSLNAILEPFSEQQNFVVLDSQLQESTNMDPVNDNDFSCIDGDMQFFTKSMSDDVKKYYEEQQLTDARVMEQLCPTSTTLDTNFNISLLDTKISHLSSNMNPQYNLNPEDLRRNEDCYDFGLQLPQSTDLDCLISTPKRNDDNSQLDERRAQERDEIIKDLMNIEQNIVQKANVQENDEKSTFNADVQDFTDPITVHGVFNDESNNMTQNENNGLTGNLTPRGLQWDSMDISSKNNENGENEITSTENHISHFDNVVIDLTEAKKVDHALIDDNTKENDPGGETMSCDFENDIPFAVGLLPLRQVQPTEEGSLLKRKNTIEDILDNVDAKCLKRKVKYKKV